MKPRRIAPTVTVCVGLWFLSAFAGPVQPFDTLTWFTQDSRPESVSVIGNPLDYCGRRIGLDVRDVELPRGWEGAYRFCGRFPVIDAVANRPLYIKQWAEESADSIAGIHRRSGLDVVTEGLKLLCGNPSLTLLKVSREAPREVRYSAFELALRESNFTPRYREILVSMSRDVEMARHQLDEMLGELSSEDLAFFRANPGYFLAPDGRKMPELTGDNSTQLDFVARARRVHMEYVSPAAEFLARAVRAYVDATRNFRISDFLIDTTKATETFEASLGGGRLIITGTGDDTLDDAAYRIDLGGNDVYMGGCGSGAMRTSFCIDHSGNDQYISDSSYTQGFGFLGVGMLVDLAGNDIYRARHFSQGAGILGVGVLWDKAGNDVYDAQTFVQGAGMFGLGMLLDDSGNDQYDCASLGQGAATTLGLGVLSDLGGNDRYGLAMKEGQDALGGLPGYGQGGALSFRPYPWEGKLTTYGGIGMLVDDYGDDTYETKGWCDQGGSYIMSLGVLVDNHGNDHYIAGTGQGSGIHITNAILVDREGNDTYEGGFRSGGSGGDRSVSMLLDYAGNDTYKSKTSSYGTGCKPFCYSLMIDYQGNDRYICEEPKNGVTFNNWESFGGVWPESDASSWPNGICMDLGGKDDYQVAGRRNNSEYNSFGHGIHLDMEWNKGDVIGKVENPLEPYPGVPQLTGMPLAPHLKEVLELKSPDLFRRFQAVGRIVEAGSEAVPVLVSTLMESENRQFNRDVLECLNYLLVEKKVKPHQVMLLATLLYAKDPEVRTVMADNFGVFRFPETQFELMDALGDTVASVRRFALRSLMTLKAENLFPLPSPMDVRPLPQRIESLAVHDPAPDVRRLAIRWLSRVRNEFEGVTRGPFLTPLEQQMLSLGWYTYDPYRLLARTLDSSSASSVRCAAAEALGRLVFPRQPMADLVGSPEHTLIKQLRRSAQSQDVYVQRACGRALAERGELEGIELLIRSLSFPSIDAFYNYDRNVPNSIAAYTNFDLPESTRYQQAKWQEWFDANKSRIDLKANVAAYRALTAMTESLGTAAETLQIKAYEDLLVKYPGYRSIGKTLAGKLNSVAWNMVTAAPASPARNLKAGLAYARRMVELVDDPNCWDTLIEALIASSMKDEARKLTEDLLRRYSGNGMLEARLKQLRL